MNNVGKYYEPQLTIAMIRSLGIFCDLVDTGSFTGAARRNFLTQSAISHHIRALEEQFGRQLVEISRPVQLTRAGELVYKVGRDLLLRYQKLEAAVRASSNGATGVLRVAAIHTVGLYELPAYTAVFLKAHPQVSLRLSYLKNPDVYDAVLGGRADIGLVDYPKPHPQLAVRRFRSERMVVVVAPSHPWASRRRISLKALDRQPFIATHTGLPTRHALAKILRRAGARMRVVSELDNVEIVKRAVEAGLGISIVPRVAIEQDLRAGSLAALEPEEGLVERPIGIVTRRRAELSAAARAFVDILLAGQRHAVAAPMAAASE